MLVLVASAVLCGCGVKVSASQYPPLIKAAERGDIAEADRLMRSGESVLQTTIGDQTALHLAAIEGQNEMVVWLLAHEANPRAEDANGKTPADFARQGGHPDTERIILDQIELFDNAVAALESGDTARLKSLLARDPRKNTALHIYVRAHMLREAERELARGADPNAKNTCDYTPVHAAVDAEDTRFLRMLLDAGADPDVQDVYGQTPLVYAALSGRTAMAEILLQAGADPSICTVWGETPAQIALRLGHSEIAAILDQGP
jgi:ankyrin repeat protein